MPCFGSPYEHLYRVQHLAGILLPRTGLGGDGFRLDRYADGQYGGFLDLCFSDAGHGSRLYGLNGSV